ncbi:MAG: hypothetical protein IJ806_11150 [Ruminococcus sp.]|nr:hypothetical protein [Ruminococcus sp.]
MTGKELLYIEDALGHEQYFRDRCCQAAQELQDQKLRDLANELSQRHSQLFSSFYSLLS